MIRLLQASTLLLFTFCPAVAQQWTAVHLHPEGALFSNVYAVSASAQGGSARLSSFTHLPIVWRGSNANWTALTTGTAEIYGMDASQQVGRAFGAALWRGTPESRVDLGPGVALAVRGNMQVGWTSYPLERAALWRGTPESFVDLHPMGAVRSMAYATDGVLQGGVAVMPGAIPHAGIWNGTAQSFTDLHPPSMVYSYVYGIAPGIQVGTVYDSPGWPTLPVHRAAVWHGSPESWADMTPPGYGGIWQFYATTGRIHVGAGHLTTTVQRAVLCYGRPDTWLDLHQFLPTGYTGSSVARAVYQDGDTIYVGGWAVGDLSGDDEAFLWVGTIPCWANCDESTTAPVLNVSDFTCFLQRFAAGEGYANCDRSTTPPVLNVGDFTCFLQRFAAGCP
jgi:hypothetical protein